MSDSMEKIIRSSNIFDEIEGMTMEEAHRILECMRVFLASCRHFKEYDIEKIYTRFSDRVGAKTMECHVLHVGIIMSKKRNGDELVPFIQVCTEHNQRILFDGQDYILFEDEVYVGFYGMEETDELFDEVFRTQSVKDDKEGNKTMNQENDNVHFVQSVNGMDKDEVFVLADGMKNSYFNGSINDTTDLTYNRFLSRVGGDFVANHVASFGMVSYKGKKGHHECKVVLVTKYGQMISFNGISYLVYDLNYKGLYNQKVYERLHNESVESKEEVIDKCAEVEQPTMGLLINKTHIDSVKVPVELSSNDENGLAYFVYEKDFNPVSLEINSDLVLVVQDELYSLRNTITGGRLYFVKTV